MGEERRIEDMTISKNCALFVAVRKAKAAPMPRRPCFNCDSGRKGNISSIKE